MYPHERSLVKDLKDEPFVLIGVNSDPDKRKLRRRMVKENLNWRNFWNGPDGKLGIISRHWNVFAWPGIYVLDHKGVIRFKNVRGPKMDAAVDQLLKEMAGDV